MKIRSLKRLCGSYGVLGRGDTIDLPNYLAAELIALNYAEPVDDTPAPREEVSQRKTKGRKNAAR